MLSLLLLLDSMWLDVNGLTDFTSGTFIHALNDLSQFLIGVCGGGAVEVLSSNILHVIAT